MQPIIELRDVGLRYADRLVLDQINIHLHHGQFAALVGPSGAGKTSLLRLILGLHAPSHGQILTQGKHPVDNQVPTIAYVPQLETVDWNFPVTVEQVVAMGLVRQGNPWPWLRKHQRQAVQAVLTQLEIEHLAQQHIRNLSGGQQQRVFLARALVAKPAMLVLDEPTTGIDPRVAETILHLLADLNQQGMTILMTTHDLNSAANHVPWIICLNQTIIAQGTPEAVFTPIVLEQTYHSEMVVVHHEGMLLIQQRPHGHSYRDLIPNPVIGVVLNPAMENPIEPAFRTAEL